MTKEVSQAYDNLRLLSRAYLQATNSLDRAPGNLEELRPFLEKQGNPEVLLKSPDDGEPYVIHWGVDFRTGAGQGNGAPVLAYERHGKNGSRYVLRMRDVQRMTDEELQKAPFPPGYRAPQL